MELLRCNLDHDFRRILTWRWAVLKGYNSRCSLDLLIRRSKWVCGGQNKGVKLRAYTSARSIKAKLAPVLSNPNIPSVIILACSFPSHACFTTLRTRIVLISSRRFYLGNYSKLYENTINCGIPQPIQTNLNGLQITDKGHSSSLPTPLQRTGRFLRYFGHPGGPALTDACWVSAWGT